MPTTQPTQTKKRSRGNGEGTVYQVKSGPNAGKWIAATPPIDGKRKTKTARTRDEANRHLVTMMSDVHQDIPLPDNKLTVKQFVTQWLEDTVQPSVKHSTYVKYESVIRVWVIPGLGSFKLSELTPQQVSHFLRQSERKGLGTNSINTMRTILRVAMQNAVDFELIRRNPVDRVKPARVAKVEIEPFTIDQIATFSEAIKGDRLEALYFLALIMGIREGELLALRWRDVDLDNTKLNIRHTLDVSAKMWGLTEAKSKGSRRTLKLITPLVRKLKEHRERQNAERNQAGELWEDHDLVFTSLTGLPIRPSALWQNYQDLLLGAKLPHKRFHDLRHTAASVMVSDNMPIKLVSKILGHSDIMITLRIYGHLFEQQWEEAYTRIEARYHDI